MLSFPLTQTTHVKKILWDLWERILNFYPNVTVGGHFFALVKMYDSFLKKSVHNILLSKDTSELKEPSIEVSLDGSIGDLPIWDVRYYFNKDIKRRLCSAFSVMRNSLGFFCQVISAWIVFFNDPGLNLQSRFSVLKPTFLSTCLNVGFACYFNI